MGCKTIYKQFSVFLLGLQLLVIIIIKNGSVVEHHPGKVYASLILRHNAKNREKIIIIIIYHDFLPTPRKGSHVKSGKTHTQSSKYTP